MPTTDVYCRLSRSRDGNLVAVERQEKDSRRLAKSKGNTVRKVWVDNDLSAADPTVRRPAFESMLEAIANGEVESITVWDQDRLVRQPAELEKLIAIGHTVGMTTLYSVAGDLDLGGDDGQMFARIKGAIAFAEVAKLKRRVRDALRDRAEKGLPMSGPVPYGFNADKMTLNTAEARLIREAADRFLAGEALAAIVSRWKARGETHRGRPWTAGNLGRILGNPRNAALRVYQGTIIGDAVWPAILDRDKWERVSTILANPARRTRHGGGNAESRRLLTGFATCWKCGKTLNAHVPSAKYGGDTVYGCRHCHGVSISAPKLDAFVADMIAAKLDDNATAKAFRQMHGALGRDLAAEVAELREQIETWSEEAGMGELTPAEWKAVSKPAKARLSALEEELDRQQSDDVLAGWVGNGGGLADAWETLSPYDQRVIVQRVFSSLTIGPGLRGSKKFDGTRVREVWAV